MYYRITFMEFDANQRDEFLAKADTLREGMQELSGIRLVHCIETGEGRGIVLAQYDTQAQGEASAPIANKLLAEMAPLLTAPPKQEAGLVMWQL